MMFNRWRDPDKSHETSVLDQLGPQFMGGLLERRVNSPADLLAKFQMFAMLGTPPVKH